MQHIKQTIASIKMIAFTMIIGVLFTSITVSAQSPADDPGIGGPGSPTVGVGADSGPVVPLDRDLSIMLIAAGIAYGYKKMKKGSVVSC